MPRQQPHVLSLRCGQAMARHGGKPSLAHIESKPWIIMGQKIREAGRGEHFISGHHLTQMTNPCITRQSRARSRPHVSVMKANSLQQEGYLQVDAPFADLAVFDDAL